MSNITVTCAYDSLNVSRLETVSEVVLNELIGSRDNDRADLMESKDREPELIVSLEDEHYLIALFDSLGLEVICGHVGVFLHFCESEASLLHFV